MERDQVLAFRLARHGLTSRRSTTLAGLWRVRARAKRSEVEVEELGRIDRDGLEAEADGVAALRGSEGAVVSWGAS